MQDELANCEEAGGERPPRVTSITDESARGGGARPARATLGSAPGSRPLGARASGGHALARPGIPSPRLDGPALRGALALDRAASAGGATLLGEQPQQGLGGALLLAPGGGVPR